ncbi:bifunctional 4-hydroxy-3-methylbut-2-enyl diphosphate reductase/30S ribosomal protein S1 [Anaerofustis stercorihominis]|uniref:bifunctional 4-hydroxy-3-methylbut-2-enyl diphosphate reductase/30S ribosomal protein S1 n=1 Tax=Anaerofustis stercorihominis TaxID=214853 RepID=UPI00210A56AC|nr:bifunctional 4-hydroxy-3-methylbut-2-enyl diphosphate reductase/30S ribosomal protein S1 [Anaerofustis stercorihominis]MCQ4794391.1 bifunctional 4-hydroxy-3-methylbut-2-enyl diphosphate reductase/30S ribosomal protein S1 [Anaerofustis stercorihominis]
MNIRKAKSAGYCFGVNKAVNTAYEASENSNEKVYTLGPLIHNVHVTNELKKKGVSIIDDLDDIDEGTVIIRSHGVGKEIYEKIKKKNLKLIDATCPYVKSIQNKVEKYHNKGYTIIIVGDSDHPEVKGVNGWCENKAKVIFTKEEAQNFKTDENVCVVAQTTIIEALFDDITNIIKDNCANVVIFNTICNATSVRQEEASLIASEVEAMVVVGDTHSSNTKKLVEISKSKCDNVFFVETASDLDDAIKKYNNIGLTAGASTPTQLIEEVINTMDNNMVDSFEKNIEESIKEIREGDIVEGEIVMVDHNEVTMNIGYKSDGIVKKADFLYDLMEDLTSKAAKGDKVKVMVMKMNDGTGNVSLSKIKVDELGALDEAKEKFDSKETVKAKITKVVKGGLIVDLGFIKAFMPASYYDVRFIKDFDSLLGKEIECRIVEFDKQKNKIIVSRKILLEEAYKERKAKEKELKEAAIAALEIGKEVEAPIKNITNFGMFIDLNGVDGFIHISDIAWKRVGNINDLYKVGDNVKAIVTELDKDNYKVKLSVKDLTKEPWQEFIENYSVGQTVKATIKNTTNFGAFAEIIPDVEGLIHISQLSHDRVNNVEDAVKTGDEVNVKIIDINKDKRKVSLSIKETMDPPKRKIERNKLYHKEDSNVTLGDIFGDLLKSE